MTPKIAEYLRESVPATPCLVVDVDRVEQNYRRLNEVLPLARVYYAAGLLDLAVKTQREAIERAEDEDKEELKATLDYYTSAEDLREQIEKSNRQEGTSP